MPYSHKILGKTPSTISKVDGITSATINKVIGLLGSSYISYSNPGTILSTSGVTSISIPFPATVVAGDLLILALVMKTTNIPNAITISGWTLHNSQRQGAGAGPGNAGSSFLFSKIATSSAESGTSLTVSFSGNSALQILIVGGKMYKYTGTKTTGYISSVNLSSTNTATSLTSLFAFASTATNNARAVSISMAINYISTYSAYSSPSGWVVWDGDIAFGGSSIAAQSISLVIVDKPLPTAGSTPGSVTSTIDASSYLAHYDFYLYSI